MARKKTSRLFSNETKFVRVSIESPGKQTKLYFKRVDNGTTYLLTPQALNSSLTRRRSTISAAS